MAKKIEAPTWAFAWKNGNPYITSIIGWQRSTVIQDAEKIMGEPWKKIYRRGGRAIRVSIEPSHTMENGK